MDAFNPGSIPPERLETYRAALGGAQGPLAAQAGASSALRSRLEAPEVKAALEANRSRMLLMNANATAQPAAAGAAAGGEGAAQLANAAVGDDGAQPPLHHHQQQQPAMGSQFRNPVFGEVRQHKRPAHIWQ